MDPTSSYTVSCRTLWTLFWHYTRCCCSIVIYMRDCKWSWWCHTALSASYCLYFSVCSPLWLQRYRHCDWHACIGHHLVTCFCTHTHTHTHTHTQGFCTPPDAIEMDDQSGGTEFVDIEGGGFDEGEGTKNVSSEVDPSNVVSYIYLDPMWIVCELFPLKFASWCLSRLNSRQS